MSRKYKKIKDPKKIRQKLLILNGNSCGLCSYPMDLAEYSDEYRLPPMAATIDHIIPQGQGGLNEFENYRLVHYFCNGARNFVEDVREHPKYFRKIGKHFNDTN